MQGISTVAHLDIFSGEKFLQCPDRLDAVVKNGGCQGRIRRALAEDLREVLRQPGAAGGDPVEMLALPRPFDSAAT
jgi:hypothetical protein